MLFKYVRNVRLYTARGVTPTRLDADCKFNAPAKVRANAASWPKKSRDATTVWIVKR